MWSVAIRADASHQMGLGHVMRCSRIADEFVRRGAKVTFVMRAHAGHAGELLQDRGLDVIALPAGSPQTRDARTWLGVPLEHDAEETRRALACVGRFQWLIVDHYGIDATWHRAVTAAADRTLVVDDLADRPIDANIVLNQNLGSKRSDYDPWIPADAEVLLGPRYALLAPEYVLKRANHGQGARDRRNLLISVGGSDPNDVTARILHELEPVLGEFTRVDVVIGRHHPDAGRFRLRWSRHANVHVHVQPPSLAELLRTADLAIGAGGSSAWERMCLGVPTVMLVLADNQRGVARTLSERGLAVLVDDPWNADHGLRVKTLGLLRDEPTRRFMAEEGRRLVDGEGTRRVVDVMVASQP